MLERMARVEIVGHRSKLDATLAAIQRAAVLHVVDGSDIESGASSYAPSREELAEIEALRELGARLDALLAMAPPPAEQRASPAPASPEEELDIESLRAAVDAELPEIESIVQRMDALRAERETLARHVTSLEKLLPLAADLVRLAEHDTVALLIERRHTAALDLLRSEVRSRVGERFELLSGPVDAETTGALLVFPRKHAAAIDEVLAAGQITRVRLPPEMERLGFRDSLQAMTDRIQAIPAEIAAAEEDLGRRRRDLARFAEARALVGRRLARAALLPRLGATERTFVLAGWAPEAAVEKLRRAIFAAVGDDVVITDRPPRPAEEAPVLLRNPPVIRAFEVFVRLFSLPRAGTLDPTPLLAVFLPLFFGMMLGDIGYSALLLAIALVVRSRLPASRAATRDLALVVAVGSVWGLVWGLVFGELFGGLGHAWFGLAPIWKSREEAHAMAPLMLLCIAMGAVHLTLGLALGLWTAWRTRNRGKLVERLGLLAALVCLFLLVAAAAGRLPPGFFRPSIAGLVTAVAILIGHHGWMGLIHGPLEVLSLVSNVLSYLRLAAIGLASVYLARVANELGAAAPLWLGVLIGLLFHTLNLALGVFSPTIQALRLHYVESFGKFYEDGGTELRPFGADADAEVRS